MDGNIGAVYRTRLADDIVTGWSVFYDHDFKHGNRRLGLGTDLQSGVLHTALNYYHPLNDWREGRADYVEQPLQGADFRLGLAWSYVRLDANVGAWRFEGEEGEKTKWRPSFGLGAGIRVLPGVFLEAGYERHDEEDSLGSRWETGLTFRFSLPGLGGDAAPLGSVAAPNLFDPVRREKRILYEERLDFAVRLEVENAFIVEPDSLGSGPTSTKIIGVISGRDLRRDETLEVVLHESTTAEHGTDKDFTFSQEIYGTGVQTGGRVTSTSSAVCATSPCRMKVPAETTTTRVEIEVSALRDEEDREPPEYIDVRIDVRDGSSNLVHSSNIARVTIGAHGNTVGFVSSSDAELMENGGEAEATVEVALPLLVPVTLQVETDGTAVRGTDYRVPTSLAVPAGADGATLTLTGIDNDEAEGDKTITLTLSGHLPYGWSYAAGTHELTLRDDDLNIGFAASAGKVNPTLVYEDVGDVTLTVAPNQPLPAAAVVGWSVTAGAADLGGSTGGSITFNQGDERNNLRTITLTVNDDTAAENAEQVTIALRADNLPEGWSLGDDTHVLTIEPSDGIVEFASGNAVTADEGDRPAFEITSDIVAPSAGIPVRVTLQGNAAEDIRVLSGDIKIPAGQDSHNFAVEIINDGTSETAEEHTIGIEAGGNFPSGWGTVSSATRSVTISANDNTVTFSAPSSANIAEAGGTATITATINRPIPSGETADVAVTPGGNAVQGDDYELSVSGGTLNGNTWTLPTQAGTATLTVTAKDTPDVPSDRSLALGFAGATLPAGWSVAAATRDININNDDAPLVMFTDSSSMLFEADGTLEVGVTLNEAAPSAGLEVSASVSSGSQYIELAAGTITVNGGETAGSFTVNLLPGVSSIPHGTSARLTLAAPNGWALGVRSVHTVGITSAVRVALTGGTEQYTVLEGESVDVNFTASSARPAAFDIDASIPANDRPFVSVDSTRANTFEPGSSRGKITLNATDNATADGDRTVTVTLAKGANFPSGWFLVPNSITLTITDDDDATVRSVGFAQATSSAFEGDDHDIEFEVTGYTVPSAGFSPGDLGISGALTDASHGGFALEDDFAVVILPGANAGDNPRFTIRINGSDGTEDTETITFTLPDSLEDGFTPGGNRTHTLTIQSSGNLAFFNAGATPPQNVATVGEGAGRATLTVSLHPFGAPRGGLPLDLEVTSGNDANLVTFDQNGGVDTDHSFRIPEGAKSHQITVYIDDNSDYVEEIAQEVVFTLTAGDGFPSGWGGVNPLFNEFTLTVNDDDNAAGKRRVGFAATRLEVTEDTSDTDMMYYGKLTDSVGRPANIPADTSFTVELALKSASSDVSYSGKTHTINSGTVLNAQGVTTNPLDTFTVRGDDNAELEEVVTIVMRPGTGFPSDDWQITPNEMEIVIAPNDNKVKFASPRTATVAESAGRHEVMVEVGMRYSGGSITLNIERSDDATATIGSDYNVGPSVTVDASSGTAAIPVDIIDDSVFGEGSESVVLTITAAGELPKGWDIDGDNDEFTLTITDNDEPPSGTAGFASGNPFAAAEGGSVQLNITSTTAPPGEVVFNWRVTESDGDSAADVGSSQGTVAIPANQTSGMFEVAVVQDQKAEAAEQITVTLTDPNTGDLFTLDSAARTHIFTIAAEDNTIAFDPASDSSILEEGATSATVTLDIDVPIPSSHTGAVTVNVGRAGSADESGDYTIEGTGYSEGVLTLPKGQATATLTVKAVDDGDYDPGENIMLSLSGLVGAPDGWNLGSQTTHTINITDNNVTGTFGFSEGNATEAFEGTPVTLTVKTSQTVDTVVPVGWRFLPSSESSPPTGGRAEIAAGSDTATFTFTPAADGDPEDDEGVLVELYDMDTNDGWTPATAEETSHALTITANENTVGFAADTPISVTEPETTSSTNIKIVSDNNVPAGGLEFTLEISGAPEGEASFSSDNTTPQTSHSFTIKGGEAEADVSLHFHADADAVSETVTLTLAAASPLTFPTAWGTAPNLTHEIEISESTVAGGTIGFAASRSDVDEPPGGTMVEHTVYINAVGVLPASAFHIAVNVEGSANAAGPETSLDYVALTPLASGIRVDSDSVSNGVLPLTFKIKGDNIPEGVETIELSLPEEQPRIAEQWMLGNNKTHTIRIAANGNTIGFAPLDYYRIQEGDSVDIVVAIDKPLPVNGSLGLSIEGGDSIDFTPLNGSTYNGGILNFSSGANSAGIRITAKNDSDAEVVGERVTFTISENPVAPLPEGWRFSLRNRQVITIEPSDNTVSLAAFVDGGRIEEGESVDIIVEVAEPLPVNRSVLLNVDEDGGIDVTALEDSVYNNGILQLDANAQSAGIRVTAKQDTAAETAEEIAFTLSERGNVLLPTGWNIGDRTRQIVTIEASDNTISFAAPSLSTITEEAGDANETTVTATMDKPIPAGLRATVAVMPTTGSTAQRGDYTLSVANAVHGSVHGNIWTLPTEAGSATLTITAVDNSVDAPDKTLTLGFAADSLPTGWIVPAGTSHDITITDDDLTGTFQFAGNQDADAEEGETVSFTVMANKATEVDVPVTWTVTSGSEDVTDPDTGTVTIPSGETSATFNIEIMDDAIAEHLETVTLTISDAANRQDLWTPHGTTEHTISVPANDNTIRIEAPSSPAIAENGGVTTITAIIDKPIPADEPADVVLVIMPSSERGRTDIRHFNDRIYPPDYTFSVAPGNGSLGTGGQIDRWILPKGTDRATLTVTANDNVYTASSEDTFADMPDKEIKLGFQGLALPEGWSVPADTSHNITILDDALPDEERNTVGIMTGTANNTLTLREGGTASFSLKISNADGTAYTGSIPKHFVWQYTPTGADNSRGQDFRIVFDEGANSFTYWFSPHRANSRSTIGIEEGRSYSDGLASLTLTAEDEDAAEGMETFHYRIHLPRSSLRTATERWKVDPDADTLTIVILASDNSVEFAREASEDVPEDGGSALITLNIADPIESGETITVDLGFTGGVEGTDFAIDDGTATYSNGTLTLPTGVEEATFTLRAVDNPADDEDRTLKLTLSNLTSALGDWGGLGAKTTHDVRITSNTKNTIGFTSDAITVAEDAGTVTSLMLQLLKPDGTAYTGAVPANLSPEYSSVGTNDNDFSFVINDTQTGTALGAQGTASIAAGSYDKGQIPITITITDDEDSEGVEEFVYTFANPSSSSQFPSTWTVAHFADKLTLTILASDGDVEFAQAGSEEISENGGRVRIALSLGNPLPDGETVTVDLGFEGATEGTDFTVINGTATYSGGKLTLPTNKTEADFTLQAQDNNTSALDKSLTLTLSNLSGEPDDWGSLGDRKSHSVTIVDDDKNTIGFMQASRRMNVNEDTGTASVMLQLSSADGTAYTTAVPANLSLAYSLTGTNNDDFSVEINLDDTGAGTALGATGTLAIPSGQSFTNGQIPITFTIKEDRIPENVEEFVYTIEASPSPFPAENWQIAPGADRLTLAITDNDNTISFVTEQRLEESDSSLRVPVTLSAYAALDITLNVAVVGIEARAGNVSRYEFPAERDVSHARTVTFSARGVDTDNSSPGHQETVNIIIEPVRNDGAENEERFWVTLTPVSPLPPGFVLPKPRGDVSGSQAIGYDSHAFFIPAHGNTINFAANQPGTVAEGESIMLELVLDNPVPSPMLIDITSDAGGDDITITPPFLSLEVDLNNNTVNSSFSITANHDNDAINEEITITPVFNTTHLPQPEGWEIPEGTKHTFIIEDDESATVLFDPDNETEFLEAEGEVSLRISFENGRVPTGGVGLSLASSDSTRVRVPAEFSSFTVGEGQGSFAFKIDVLADDNGIEDTVTLTLRKGTDGSGAGFPDEWELKDDAGELTLELTIVDRATIGFAKSSDVFTEPDSAVVTQTVPLVFSSTPTRDLTLAFNVTPDGAVENRNTGDFFVDTLYTVEVADVSNGRADYPILILPDDEYEREEGFTITLAEDQPDLPARGWYIDPDNASYTVTIPINDLPKRNTLGFATSTMTVKEQTKDIEIEVTSSAPAPVGGLPLKLTLTKEAGSRTVFTDDASSTTRDLTIEQNESSASFSISIFDDASESADEDVLLNLSLGESFPHEWGTGYARTTIPVSTFLLTIDDRDNGVIGFVDPLPEFYEPYPGETTYKSGVDDAVDRYFEMSISNVPRQAFDLRLIPGTSYLRPAVSQYEVVFPRVNRVTPEDAADGRLSIRFPIETANNGDAPREYGRLTIDPDSLPEGWSIGEHEQMDYAVIDSFTGGQIGFAPNDTRRNNGTYNLSTLNEGQSASMALTGDSYGSDSPVWVRIEGGLGSMIDSDLNFDDRIVVFPRNQTFHTVGFTTGRDDVREEARDYTLVLEEAPGFPGERGRRIDPTRSRYTFTVLASGGFVSFSPDNNTTLTEGDGLRELSLVLEGGKPAAGGLKMSLSSSNPDIVAIPDSYRNFTIPEGYSSANYPFSIEVKNDDNSVVDTVTLTLHKGREGSAYFPFDWEFRNGANELTLDLAVVDKSSTPPNGMIQFFLLPLPGGDPSPEVVARGEAKEPHSAYNVTLEVSAPPLVAFNLPIETSGTASFGSDETDDATGRHLDPSDADTFFVRIDPTNAANGRVSFIVIINEDDLLEEAETLILTIPEDAPLPQGFTLGGRRQFITTIPGNDNTVEFTSSESSITEGGAHATLAININRQFPPETSASVFMRIEPGSGVSDNDYTISNVTGGSFDADTDTFTIPAGVDSVTFNVAARDDTVAEPDESITFTLDANGSSFPGNWGGVGPQASHTVTIKDDEVTSIGFVGTVVDPVDENGTVSMTVNISSDIGSDLAQFAWAVSHVEDVENPTGTATIIDGDYSLEINVKDDDLAELAEEVTVILTDPDTSDIWAIDERNATRTFTIPASDNNITFAAPSPATISENGGIANITAFIRRPAPSGEAPVVAVTPSGANSGDYNLSVAGGNGSLSSDNTTWTLPAGADSAILTVTAVDNSNDDVGSKTLTLGFADAASMPAGWSVSGAASHTIAIADDDDAASTGTVQFAHASSIAIEGGENTILQVPVLVTGTPATAFDLKVNVIDNSGDDDAATQGGDFTVPATLNLARSGSTNLEVTIVADDVAELAENIVLEIPSEDNGLPGDGSFSLGETVRHTVTIGINDNFAGFATAESSVLENVPGGVANVPVNINLPAPSPIAFNVSTTAVTAVEGEDYSLLTSHMTIDAGEQTGSIQVGIVNDAYTEVDEDIVLTITASDALPRGWSLGTTSHTLTIESEDRIISFTERFSHSVTENGDFVEATIQIAPPLARKVSIPLFVEGRGAAFNYEVVYPESARVVRNWVEFAPEEDSEFVRLRFRATDDKDSDPEKVDIFFNERHLPSYYTVGEHSTWTINIVDNDTRTVSLVPAPARINEGTTGKFRIQILPPLDPGQNPAIQLWVHGELSYPDSPHAHLYFPTSGQTDSYAIGAPHPTSARYEGRHVLDYDAAPCGRPHGGIDFYPEFISCSNPYYQRPRAMKNGISARHGSTVTFNQAGDDEFVSLTLRALQDPDRTDDRITVSLREETIPDGYYIPDNAVRTFTTHLIDNRNAAAYMYVDGKRAEDIDISGRTVVPMCSGERVAFRVTTIPPMTINIGEDNSSKFTGALTTKVNHDIFGTDSMGEEIIIDVDPPNHTFTTARIDNNTYKVWLTPKYTGTYNVGITTDGLPDGVERGDPWGMKLEVRGC